MRRLIGCLLALALASCGFGTPIPAFAGSRGIGNNNPASNAQEIVCVDAVTGVPYNCAGGGSSSSSGGAVADVPGTGTIAAGTLNAAYTIPIVAGQATAGFTVTGLTASGAILTVERSYDNGTTWSAVNEINLAGVMQPTLTVDGQFRFSVAATTKFRLRVSTVGTGTITVASNVSVGTGPVRMVDALPPGTNTLGTVNVGVRSDFAVSGTITATDAVVAAPAGNGALLSGASTAGSIVAIKQPGGLSSWIAEIFNSATSNNLYFEVSIDSTTGYDGHWINVNGRQTGVANTSIVYDAQLASGDWRGNLAGATWFRVRSVGALTGTPSIVLTAGSGIGPVFLNSSLPGGSNQIGSLLSPANFAPAQVSIATTATQIAAAHTGRNLVIVTQGGTTDVYIGGAGVTTSTGLLLPGTKGASLTLPYTGALYGVVGSGTDTLSEAETY